MKSFSLLLCLLWLATGFESFSQNKKTEWFLTANGKGNLAQFKVDKFSLLTFEFGFLIH